MKIKIHPTRVVIYFTFTFILSTFNELAGPLSTFISFLLPSIGICSILHLIFSLFAFTFHQKFSNDHPQKGESVFYYLFMANEGPLPLAYGTVTFAESSTLNAFTEPAFMPIKRPTEYTAEIRCTYRGTYQAGLRLYEFTDILGLLSVENKIEPRIFYVYPELIRLDVSIEKIAHSSGGDQGGKDNTEEDPSVFEFLSPLREGKSFQRLSYKYWAKSGIPALIICGQSRSAGLRLILDLWPGEIYGEEKLASEDMATSATFSLLMNFSQLGIPVEFIIGATEKGVLIDSSASFEQAFQQSTNIIFSDSSFPLAAFDPDTTVLLISTRPLIYTEIINESDLYSTWEKSLHTGKAPHLLLCPPPSHVEREKEIAKNLLELQLLSGGQSLIRICDPLLGVEDIQNALKI